MAWIWAPGAGRFSSPDPEIRGCYSLLGMIYFLVHHVRVMNNHSFHLCCLRKLRVLSLVQYTHDQTTYAYEHCVNCELYRSPIYYVLVVLCASPNPAISSFYIPHTLSHIPNPSRSSSLILITTLVLTESVDNSMSVNKCLLRGLNDTVVHGGCDGLDN